MLSWFFLIVINNISILKPQMNKKKGKYQQHLTEPYPILALQTK